MIEKLIKVIDFMKRDVENESEKIKKIKKEREF